ncbi:hypothetical protein LMG31886_09430 [Xanthomonas hydrangeae]|nr:hypothetical protein LMG31884_09590 [Xanthomonas hydrangeae]CAD7714123.1 hypothetical protein LMG31884_09590 [Xanthomonas hydrangeae]CAD7722510.1 hypothetical protein LMG31887_09590 [Xanthomonas hydrangeae]CAD7722514.1 hypothetical protein LMG31887_09590 [Xanthomonas hydrangeae]CAD7723584.1 hypothetical protein LMG31885_06070 [Xanthomonas hydrangeae]
MQARWRHPCRHTVPQSARTPHQRVNRLLCSKPCTPTIATGPCPPTVAGPYAARMPRKSLHGRTCGVSREGGRARALQPNRRSAALQSTRSLLCLKPCTPTISTGPCPPTVAGPYAAWMPRKSLHGRTCGVSRDGGRARALQPSRRSRRSATDAPAPFDYLRACASAPWMCTNRIGQRCDALTTTHHPPAASAPAPARQSPVTHRFPPCGTCCPAADRGWCWRRDRPTRRRS